MPNWVAQNLFAVGPKSIVDRFVRVGFKRCRRDACGCGDDELIFTRLCPLKRSERKIAYSHDSGVVLAHYRTRTQACFWLITSWDYPAEFYARLPKGWPGLTFACAVNEDMGQFGGVIVVIDGEVHNLVRDYDSDYDRPGHRREVRAVLKRYFAFLVRDRAWRIMPTCPSMLYLTMISGSTSRPVRR
jgi:hypothetical protein